MNIAFLYISNGKVIYISGRFLTRNFEFLFHGGHIGRLKVHPWTTLICSFYSFELKLCRMVELCISKMVCFLFFDFNSFWQENDLTRLTAKFKIQDMAKQMNNLKRARRDRIRREFLF